LLLAAPILLLTASIFLQLHGLSDEHLQGSVAREPKFLLRNIKRVEKMLRGWENLELNF
jgi:hypothetical protein